MAHPASMPRRLILPNGLRPALRRFADAGIPGLSFLPRGARPHSSHFCEDSVAFQANLVWDSLVLFEAPGHGPFVGLDDHFPAIRRKSYPGLYVRLCVDAKSPDDLVAAVWSLFEAHPGVILLPCPEDQLRELTPLPDGSLTLHLGLTLLPVRALPCTRRYEGPLPTKLIMRRLPLSFRPSVAHRSALFKWVCDSLREVHIKAADMLRHVGTLPLSTSPLHAPTLRLLLHEAVREGDRYADLMEGPVGHLPHFLCAINSLQFLCQSNRLFCVPHAEVCKLQDFECCDFWKDNPPSATEQSGAAGVGVDPPIVSEEFERLKNYVFSETEVPLRNPFAMTVPHPVAPGAFEVRPLPLQPPSLPDMGLYNLSSYEIEETSSSEQTKVFTIKPKDSLLHEPVLTALQALGTVRRSEDSAGTLVLTVDTTAEVTDDSDSEME
jgi:hypothetical protein